MKAKGSRTPIPTESEEQQALFQWAGLMQGRHPELALMYHIPNEGKRSAAQGARLRAEGLRKGVPDICLPVARGGFAGLYIELKRTKGGKTTPEQEQWISALSEAGHCAVRCDGWQAATVVIAEYLSLGKGNPYAKEDGGNAGSGEEVDT